MITFQGRVALWLMECFGPEVASDKAERDFRFLEEALELVQAGACSREAAHVIVDYVYDRPIGQHRQEVGCVMVTLAALCGCYGVSMDDAGDDELARINSPTIMQRCRDKQASKPKAVRGLSPLPGVA
jgi:hypothetical protein